MGITNPDRPHKVNNDLSKIVLFEAFDRNSTQKCIQHQNKQGLSRDKEFFSALSD